MKIGICLPWAISSNLIFYLFILFHFILFLFIHHFQLKMVGDRTPDYRGLADLLGFEAIEVMNFWERNPSDTLFFSWATCKDGHLRPAVLRTLVECLEQLERTDILEECRGLIGQ
jgi:hypothetical protein